jgi:hypothetical protein
MGRPWTFRPLLATALLGTGLLGGACGSVRTDLPTGLDAPGPVAVPAVTTVASTAVASTEATTPTTASAFKSPGEKHPLPGGTVAASYPRVGVRPPKGVAPPPAGQAWALVNVRFCAADATPIAGALVDPARFRVEVPGQGEVANATDPPALSKTPLKAGTSGVAPGTCLEGSVAYLVAGEGHIEAISYDSGAGLLRWAT